MSKIKSYCIEPEISPKEFLARVIESFQDRELPYDIFNLAIGEVKKETRKLYFIKGEGEYEFECTAGDYDKSSSPAVLRFRPVKDVSKGKGIALLPFEEGFVDIDKKAMEERLANAKPAKDAIDISSMEEALCKEALKQASFRDNFPIKADVIKGLTYSGETAVTEIALIEVTYYRVILYYRDKEIHASSSSLKEAKPSIKGLEEIPAKTEEELAVATKAKKIAEIKKPLAFLSILPFLCFFVGIYMTIASIGKNYPTIAIYIVLLCIGLAGIVAEAVFIMHAKKKAARFQQEEKKRFEGIKESQLRDLLERISAIY